MSTSTDRRLWRCPSCGRDFRIPGQADDPLVCRDCETQELEVVPDLPRPEPIVCRPLSGPVAVAALAIVAIATGVWGLWLFSPEPGRARELKAQRDLSEKLHQQGLDAIRQQTDDIISGRNPDRDAEQAAIPQRELEWVKVATFAGAGPKQTEVFFSKNGVLRLTWGAGPDQGAGFLSATIVENGSRAEHLAINQVLDGRQSDSTLVRCKSGPVYLDVNAANAAWGIIIEDWQ